MSETAVDSKTPCREAVGVFHEWAQLRAAVDELLLSGFDRAEISMLAGEKVVEHKLGHVYQRVSELEDDMSVPRVAFVGKDSLTEGKASAIGVLGYLGAATAVGAVVASGGALAWVIVAGAAAGGGGAALGTLLARAMGRHHAKDIQSQIDKGGLLLWVRTCDGAREPCAMEILRKHGAEDVHVHDFEGVRVPEINPLGGWQPDPFLPQAKL
jgi:hypothetical protein